MISKSEMTADIGIAIVGTAMLIFGAGAEGFIAKCAIGWGGLFMGYLITTYMGEDNV